MHDLEAELERVAEREPQVRAWVVRHDADELRKAYRALPPGPLNRWTIGVKDVIDTADSTTERGSPIYSGRTTVNDAACVALVRRAGALVTGKTATTEFALFTPTVTTNPHHPAHTPGGSSSGSGAAVADGMVRAAFGTQTVGSVLRPAAYCGVVGFKPTHQLVPLTGVATLAHSFDTVGWLTRSVADAATMFEAVAGGRPAASVERIRIGHYRSHHWDAAQPELASVLDGAAGRLSDAGIDVIELEPLAHLERVFDAADTILHYEMTRVFAWERTNHLELISPLVRKMLERADQIDLATYVGAQRVLGEARRAHDAFLRENGMHAMLTPSAPGEAPLMNTTGDSIFNRTWTSLGVPAINLPSGLGPNGLPVGVQLAGRAWADDELLAVAGTVEAAVEGG